jgi:hypothetical protein
MNSHSSLVEEFTNNSSGYADNKTVELVRTSTATVLKRLKNNLDVSVNEKSSHLIDGFIHSLSGQVTQYMNAWLDANENQLMVVPDGTRYVSRENGKVTIIVEQKPCVRRINFLSHYYNVSFPFVQYLISFTERGSGDIFDGMAITCSKKPMSSFQSEVHSLPMPNIGGNRVCVGTMATASNNGRDLNTKVNHIVAGYWGSQFNMDLHENLMSFFATQFRDEFKTLPDDRNYASFHRCFAAWQEKSTNPLWCFEASYPSTFQIGRFLPQDISVGGKQATMNRISQEIEKGIGGLIRNLAGDLSGIDVYEENRSQPHYAALQQTIRCVVNDVYVNMWSAVHSQHERKVAKDNQDLDLKRNDIENSIRNSSHILNNIELQRNNLNDEKLRVQCELFTVYQHLVKQLEEVNQLRAKLSEYIDEEGNPTGVRKRGRPRKNPLPVDVSMAISRAASSPILVDSDGNPVVRKRGRPRKNPLPV